ncbi:DNAhelicaserecq,putative, partial [Macrophomina phaseolina MS6]
MCQSFGEMIDKAQQTVLASVSIEVLFEMIRKEANVKPAYPFEARMGDDTKQRYKQAWQRIIGYVFRTHGMA